MPTHFVALQGYPAIESATIRQHSCIPKLQFVSDCKHPVLTPRRLFHHGRTRDLLPADRIFENVFDEDDLVITPKTSAADVDGWDSLTHIRLILTVEKAFKVKFSTSEIGKLENVGDLVALIKARA